MPDAISLLEQLGGHLGTAGGLIAWTVSRFQALIKKIDETATAAGELGAKVSALSESLELLRTATTAAVDVLEQKQTELFARLDRWKNRSLDTTEAVRSIGDSRNKIGELRERLASVERQLAELKDTNQNFALDEEFNRFVRETDRKWGQLERALDRLEALIVRSK